MIGRSLRCNNILLERMQHYATVRFNNERGRKTHGRALESGNRSRERISLCVCAPLHMCARLQMEKGIQGKMVHRRQHIIEEKIRNTYLWYQKRGLKY